MDIVPQTTDARKEAMTTGFVSVGKKYLENVIPQDVAVRDFYAVARHFRYGLAYSEKKYDQTFVLTAGHTWLLDPNSAVPDGIILDIEGKNLSTDDQHNWFVSIADQIRQYCPPESQLYFHTGAWYSQLFTHLSQPDPLNGSPTCYSLHTPMRDLHLPNGKQLAFYKSEVGQLPSVKNERRSK